MHLIVVHRSLEQLHFKIVPLARGEVKEETWFVEWKLFSHQTCVWTSLWTSISRLRMAPKWPKTTESKDISESAAESNVPIWPSDQNGRNRAAKNCICSETRLPGAERFDQMALVQSGGLSPLPLPSSLPLHFNHHTNVIQMQSRWVVSFLIKDQNPPTCFLLIYIWTNLLPAGSSWGEFLSRGKLISIAPGSQPPLLLLYEDKDGENWAGWYGWWKLITITNIGRWGWACQVPRLTWMK